MAKIEKYDKTDVIDRGAESVCWECKQTSQQKQTAYIKKCECVSYRITIEHSKGTKDKPKSKIISTVFITIYMYEQFNFLGFSRHKLLFDIDCMNGHCWWNWYQWFPPENGPFWGWRWCCWNSVRGALPWPQHGQESQRWSSRELSENVRKLHPWGMCPWVVETRFMICNLLFFLIAVSVQGCVN